MFDGTQGCPVFYGVSVTVLFRSVTAGEKDDFIFVSRCAAGKLAPEVIGSGAACGGDLVGCVPEGAKYRVGEAGPTRRLEEVRVDVFPHDLAGTGHLEKPAMDALANQRVAVGEALGAGHVRAEELEHRRVAVLPDDRAGPR